MGIAIKATRYTRNEKHEETDIGTDPDSRRHMGGRADNIDNHKLDNDNFAIEHNLIAGFAERHVHFAIDDAIVFVAERHLKHQPQFEHAERDWNQQLPGGYGAQHERERNRFDEQHHDFDP